MCADNQNVEDPEGEESPFGQEEVLPSTPEGEAAADGQSADYMPEDAVIEYGGKDSEGYYDAVSDYLWSQSKKEEPKRKGASGFYPNPATGKEAALEYLYGEEGEKGEAEGAAEDDPFRGKLDRMYPEEGQEEGGVGVAEPYPTAPAQEEEAPGSALPYGAAIAPGPRKGPSPEVADLLERTSRREEPIGVGEPRKRGKGLAILFVFIIALTATALFEYRNAGIARDELKKYRAQFDKDRARLEADLNSKGKELSTQIEQLQAQLTKVHDEKKSAEEKYEADIVPARMEIEQLKVSVEQLQEKAAGAEEFKKELREKTDQLVSLNINTERFRKDANKLSKNLMLRGAKIADLEREIGEKDNLIERLGEELEKTTKGEPGIISPAEFAKLRASVLAKTNQIDRLGKELDQMHRILDEIQAGAQPIVKNLQMELVRKGKQIIELQRELEEEQIARRLYSSPQSTIVEWAKTMASDELDQVIKYYATGNEHRKRFYAGGAKLETLTEEHEEFSKFGIEPEVLLITIHADKQQATAKVNIRLTIKGNTTIIPATMKLVHEYERWAIVEEGF